MAARRKYPAPHEQLRALAEAALRRGQTFDHFWLEAVRPGLVAVTWATPAQDRPLGAVIWPRDTFDRKNCIAAMVCEEVREGWRRAYEGAPPSTAEAALTRVGSAIDRIIAVTAEIEALPEAEEPQALRAFAA